MFKHCSMRSILFNPYHFLWSLALAKQHCPGAQVSSCSPKTVGTSPPCPRGEEGEPWAVWAELSCAGLEVRGWATIHPIYLQRHRQKDSPDDWDGEWWWMRDQFSSLLWSLYLEENSCLKLKSYSHKANAANLVFNQPMPIFPVPAPVPKMDLATICSLGHRTRCWDNMSFPPKCISNSCSHFSEPDLTTGLLESKIITLGVGLAFYYYIIEFGVVILHRILQASPT